MDLAQLYQSEAPLVTVPVPLEPRPGSTSDTPMVVTRQLGPVDLYVGDHVLLTAREVFTNPNYDADGYWKVGGVQSEHWTLPVMASMGVRCGPTVDADAGRWARRQTAENFDNIVHHKVFDQIEWDVIQQDMLGAFYFTVCYFASSQWYRQPGDTVTVEAGNYGKLEAAVFR